MKVWFSGSHSVGKSTLARYVSEKYNLPLITEVARAILSEQELHVDTLRYDIALVDSYQTQVFNRQLEEEAKFTKFVSDRSAIDAVAYAGHHSRILPQLLGSSRLPDYISILKEPSSILFFVSPSRATLASDGVRETINWDNIIAINAMLKLLYEMFEIRYFQINTDNMQERVKQIDSVLSLVK